MFSQAKKRPYGIAESYVAAIYFLKKKYLASTEYDNIFQRYKVSYLRY